MNDLPALGSAAPHGLLGVLKSWLKGEPNEVWQTSAIPSSAIPSSEILAHEDTRPSAHGNGTVRVLVADDNPVNLMLIAVQLESRGLVPLVAADGAEAVALAYQMPFDLILMDLQMPILDGFGATTAIRRFEAQRPRPAMPIVAYSSTPVGGSLLAARGINGSLSKPCTDQELEDCLLQWCPGYRPAPAERAVGLPPHRAEAVRPAPGLRAMPGLQVTQARA